MITTKKEIESLDIKEKSYSRGCGKGLVLYIEPKQKGGGISFRGTMRIKKNGKQKQVTKTIGKYGNSVNEYSLPQAMKTWLEIKEWAVKNNRDPRDYGIAEKVQRERTIKDVIEKFLAFKKQHIKEGVWKEYKNKFNYQILENLDGEMSIKDFEWNNGGRRLISDLYDTISRGVKFDLADRCKNLLRQCFDYAISKGWMDRNSNPATTLTIETSKHQPKHHPCISWSEVPTFLKAVNLNRCDAHQQIVLSTKLLLMTFLRSGALTRLEWNWIDEDQKLLTISGKTSGLKRKLGKNDHIPHLVPLTPEMIKLLDQLKELNGNKKYVFQPIRQSRYPHLDPSSPNNYLRNLGYKDELRAHGWRSVALTVGQDVLKTNHEIIQRQMGHLVGDKVRQAYDRSEMIPERRKFLEEWCSLLVKKGLKI